MSEQNHVWPDNVSGAWAIVISSPDVRLKTKEKVGMPESFKVGWCPQQNNCMGRVTLSYNDDDGSENITEKWKCAFSQTLSRLFRTAQFVRCSQSFLVLNSYGLYPCSNRERKICRRMSTSSTKRRIGRFHLVVVQWTSKKCKKSVITCRAVVLFIKPIDLFSFYVLFSQYRSTDSTL